MKNLYVIPGWCDTTGRKPYSELCEIARKKGYNVIKKNPQWDEPLSKQIFPIFKNDVIFGFSLGAIFACMVAKKSAHKKVIAASMSPVLDVPDQTLRMLGRAVATDCKRFKYGGVKAVYLYGEREVDESLDKIRTLAKNAGSHLKIVPGGCHRLDTEYIKHIAREL